VSPRCPQRTSLQCYGYLWSKGRANLR
jgi:hypothetical protein